MIIAIEIIKGREGASIMQCSVFFLFSKKSKHPKRKKFQLARPARPKNQKLWRQNENNMYCGGEKISYCLLKATQTNASVCEACMTYLSEFVLDKWQLYSCTFSPFYYFDDYSTPYLEKQSMEDSSGKKKLNGIFLLDSTCLLLSTIFILAFNTACICKLQPDSQRWRHHRNSGKRKKNFNISFNLNILAFLAIKLVQILFKQVARYLFGMIWYKLKKKIFFNFKFCDQLLIHIKTKLFFFNKDCSKVKDKKIYYINWKALPENATQGWKYLRIPLLVQAV